MLFVDDDQAGVGQGREQARAGADDEVDLAPGDAVPGFAALATGEAAVPDGGAGDAVADTRRQLRGQADFRQQEQHLLALGDDLFGEVEVDQGFSAAGHAVEEEGFVTTEGGGDGLDGHLLLVREGETFVPGFQPQFLDVLLDFLDDGPGGDEFVEDAAAGPEGGEDLADGSGDGRQVGPDLTLTVREFADEFRDFADQYAALGFDAGPHRGGHGGGQDLTQAGAVIAGGPGAQAQQVGRQAHAVDQPADGFDGVVRGRPVAGVDHEALALAVAEGHGDAIANGHRQPRRDGVGEGADVGQIEGDGGEVHRGWTGGGVRGEGRGD